MEEPDERALWFVLLPEVALLGWVFAVLAGSFTGHTSLLSDVAVAWRALALLVVGTFLVAPVWVYYDVRRADDSLLWVHVVVLPLVNLLGLAAYLHHRRQRDPESGDEEADGAERGLEA